MTDRGSYLCCRPSVAVKDGAGGRGSDAAVRGCAACVGRGVACAAAGAGRETDAAVDAARVGSVQRAVGAGSAVDADCVGCAGRVGYVGCGRAEEGAVRGESRDQDELGQDGTRAPGHCWQSGCWVGCLTGCSEY